MNKFILYKTVIPLLIIIWYSIQFENYKIYFLGSIFTVLSVYYTFQINTKSFYIIYTFCLFFLFYLIMGLFFMLFFIINDLLIYLSLDYCVNISPYIISVIVLWIYVYSSVYLSLKITKSQVLGDTNATKQPATQSQNRLTFILLCST